MPLPDNTAPMMSGTGPYGPLEMGGMFSVLKVRADQKPGDYQDPGWFRHPAGTVAREYTGPLAEASRPPSAPAAQPAGGTTLPKARKPGPHAGH